MRKDRDHERDEHEYEANRALRAAIDAGDASGIAKNNVFARVRKSLNLPTSKAPAWRGEIVHYQ
jgi:hypothetical protein